MSQPAMSISRVAGLPVTSDTSARRRLQLVLAGIWLLDAVLQYQSFMFTRGFPAELAAAAPGNPLVVAGPVRWSASLVAGHLALANAAFATLQLLIGLGIAWRPAARVMLAVSVGWALAIWWLGEGLGLLLTGTASPVNGAPGAALLYALAAVLLWPEERAGPAARFSRPAARFGRPATWLVLWGGLAALVLQPAARAPGAVSGMLTDMASGQPGWLAGMDRHLASALSQHGQAAAVTLAVALAVAAVLGCLPGRARAAVVLAVILAAAIWMAQGLGGLFSGTATDPNTGPLLALIALAYWPARPAQAHTTGPGTQAPSTAQASSTAQADPTAQATLEVQP